jgi:type I restriction enzyme S subunit
MATPQTWQRVKLGDLGTFRNGVNFGKDKKGEGLGLINVKDLFTDSPYIKFETLDKVDLAKKKGINNYYVQEGDLFFSRSSVKRDGVGVVSLARKANNEVVHCGFVIRFRPTSSEIYPLYLTYLLRSDYYRQVIIGISGGSAIINISQDSLGALEIDLPPLPIQRKIAAILSAYDDLIENNTRRIEILEEMARSIYREWFVNFRFPGHEQVQMVDSDLGPIPEGWEVISLGQLLDIKHGYAFKGEYFSKEPTSDILLTPGNFKFGGGFKDDKLKYYDGSVPKEFVLNPGDLLVTMTDLSKEGDTLGYPAFVPPSKELRFLHNQRLGKISLHPPKLGFNHLYHIFCSDSYRHHVLASATGSTVKHTAPDRIKSFSIALPTQEICNRFEMITSSLTRKIVLLNQKNANLRQTRDLLLPRLISGEIDVENLDIKTGEIAA